MAFCWEGRPFHPSSAEASCLLSPSHWGSQGLSGLALGRSLHVFHPQLVNFRAEFMRHRFVRLTGVQMTRGGGIQEGLSKLVAGTWGLPEWSRGKPPLSTTDVFAD